MEEEGSMKFPFLLLLPILLSGCGRREEKAVQGLPGGDLLGRLPSDSLAALSFPQAGPLPLPARIALEWMGFGTSETDLLSRSEGWAAALTPEGRIALLRRAQGSPGGLGRVPRDPSLSFFSRPHLPFPSGPLLGSRKPWRVLARSALPWKGHPLLWVSLAGLLDSGRVRFPGNGIPVIRGSFLLSSKVRELLNTDAFEAALFRLEGENRGRFGLFVWPDRVGLPGVLLSGKGGLCEALPEGKETFLAWRIQPDALDSILVGLESLQGVWGRMVKTGLALFRARVGLDPGKDILPALEGTFLFRARPGGGALMLGLRKVPAADRLCLALGARRSALAGVLGLFSGRRFDVLYKKRKFLYLSWGKGPGHSLSLVHADPDSRRLGFFRLPLPSGGAGKEKILEGEFLRAPYGMEGRIRVRN